MCWYGNNWRTQGVVTARPPPLLCRRGCGSVCRGEGDGSDGRQGWHRICAYAVVKVRTPALFFGRLRPLCSLPVAHGLRPAGCRSTPAAYRRRRCDHAAGLRCTQAAQHVSQARSLHRAGGTLPTWTSTWPPARWAAACCWGSTRCGDAAWGTLRSFIHAMQAHLLLRLGASASIQDAGPAPPTVASPLMVRITTRPNVPPRCSPTTAGTRHT